MPEKLELPDGDGRYLIVNLVARRARDINRQRQASNLLDEETPDPLDVADNELENGLLRFEFHHHLVGQGDDFRASETQR